MSGFFNTKQVSFSLMSGFFNTKWKNVRLFQYKTRFLPYFEMKTGFKPLHIVPIYEKTDILNKNQYVAQGFNTSYVQKNIVKLNMRRINKRNTDKCPCFLIQKFLKKFFSKMSGFFNTKLNKKQKCPAFSIQNTP